eukprot:1142817-Pelagomonas_calceolata.AAC.2
MSNVSRFRLRAHCLKVDSCKWPGCHEESLHQHMHAIRPTSLRRLHARDRGFMVMGSQDTVMAASLSQPDRVSWFFKLVDNVSPAANFWAVGQPSVTLSHPPTLLRDFMNQADVLRLAKSDWVGYRHLFCFS